MAALGKLQGIIEAKRAEIQQKRKKHPLEPMRDKLPHSDRDFRGAIAAEGLSLIAEVKHRSPSRGVIRPAEAFDPGSIAEIYDRHAQAISVLIDGPNFGGQPEYLGQVRERCRRPLLAKEFTLDAYQILEARHAGADAVLLIASVLSTEQIADLMALAKTYEMDAIVEVHSRAELDSVLGDTDAELIGINSRDLKTFTIDTTVIPALAPIARAAGKWVIAESGISTPEQVEAVRPIADATLIGTSLMAADDIEAQLEFLGW